MKRLVTSLLVLVLASTVIAQEEQSGIAAKMTAANGREFPAFLQGMDDENITFQLFKNPNNRSVPARLISKIEFVGRFDALGVEQLFNDGDYEGMIDKMKSEMKPSLDAYWPFMSIENNYQDLFTSLMKAYLRLGDAARALEVSGILLQNKDPGVKGQAESIGLLAALRVGNIKEAETMLADIDSKPGQLYLGACIEQAKGNPTNAVKLVDELIAQYPNDLSWMPQAELLNAHLYLDMGLTNSAIQTARQVKNIYADSDVANEAIKLYEETTLAKQKAEEAAEARSAAEEAALADVKARAQARAQGYGFGAKGEDEGADTNAVEQVEEPMPESDLNSEESAGEDSSSSDEGS